ncbi:hypothetical protein chiPu_0031493, partial [Chiloscyllium punctatum]|nr:hypothetical protein [Chiloscyllium punctatum]
AGLAQACWQTTSGSEVHQRAQTKNPGVLGLDAGGIIAASARIDHVLGVEFEVHPAGRLPSVPGFDRDFVAACVRGERSRIHVGGAHREADFVFRAPGERSGVPEAQGDLVVLIRRPMIGDRRIEEHVPTLCLCTLDRQPLQDRLVDAIAAALVAEILIGNTAHARCDGDDARQAAVDRRGAVIPAAEPPGPVQRTARRPDHLDRHQHAGGAA